MIEHGSAPLFAIIGLGSNLGDREALLTEALERLHWRVGPVLKLAPLFETPPFGGVADLPFLNSAALVQTRLSPIELLGELHAIEANLGRIRTARWENRVIDLDILLLSYDRNGAQTLVCTEDALQVPHPGLLDRDFALVPAARVCPEWRFTDAVDLRSHVAQHGYELPKQKPWPRLRIHAGETAGRLHAASPHRS